MKFKHDEDRELFFMLHPILIMIYADLYFYAYEKHGVELTITSTISTKLEDKKLNRVSNSHNSRRAIDIRTRDLGAEITNSLIDYVNTKQENKRFHYVSHGGKRRLAYYHNNHIHLAIHSKYSLPPLEN